MRKIISGLALLCLLSLALYVPVGVNAITPSNTLVIGTIGMPETVDPSWSYDTASSELIFNVYEPLLYYKVDRTKDPKEQGSIDEFVPGLATSWEIKEIDETSPLGVHWSYRFIFKIRCEANGNPPVYFHNGAVLTPEDVEYSIERILVQDRSGGPEWMWYVPLLGRSHAPAWSRTTAPTLINWIAKIDQAVESNSTHVWFNFNGLLGPPISMLQIMTQTWGSVLCKSWCVSDPNDWDGLYTEPFHFKGDANLDGVISGIDSGFLGLHWPPQAYDANADFNRDGVISGIDSGTIGLNWGTSGDAKGWYKYHNPSKSPLDITPKMCGTGPYKFDYIDYVAKKWHIIAFTGSGYWGGWPSALNTPSGTYQGYLDDVLYQVMDEWTTRRDAFLAGDLDFCYVPREYRDQVLGQSGIECYYPIPTLAVDAIFYTFAIPSNSPYCGTAAGGAPLPDNTFDRNGLPANFFTDIHIRRAFSYAFNYTQYVEQVFLGEAVHPATPLVVGLGPTEPYNIPVILRDGGDITYNNGTTIHIDPIPVWPFDLSKVADEFKLAFGGTLTDPGPAWTTGFTLTITYNTGNVARLRICEMLKYYIETYHPLATINIQEVDWDTYLDDLVNYPYYQSKMPIFIIGWLADYPDVYNFAVPFMYTEGDFTLFQSYSNATMDALIDASISPEAIADPALRTWYYWQIGLLYREDMPSLPTIQGIGRHFQRTWVKGWYYNPIYPGDYFYHIWKEMP